MLKISAFYLEKQKSFILKKLKCTMDSSYFSQKMATWRPNFPHPRLWEIHTCWRVFITCWRLFITSWRSVIARGRSVIAGFGSGSSIARSGGGSAITGFRSRSVIAWGLALIGVVGSIVLVVVVTMVSVMAMTIWLNVGSGRNQYQWYLKL